ncbi:MAG: SCO family protein [Planctomycetota bacterium]
MFATPVAAQTSKVVTGGDQWGANYFPNYELTNQDGETVRFFDDCIKDKVVLISFIYTSCPDACPLETARIAEVQGILGDRVGKDVFFWSITIDPENDTPEVLKEYRERYQAGPGWQFLTGKLAEISRLRMKLGLYDPSYEQDLSDHGLNMLIGNQKTGRWMRTGPFENPYVMATQIGEWLHNWKLPRKNDRDYADAPEIRDVSEGERLFRTRCNSCHAIGGTNTQLARLGPNLFAVTDRREREWLVRWLLEPDVMLAEKDPIAMQMFEAYNKVPMPNMQLSPKEAEQLLVYLEEESQRVAAAAPTLVGEDGEEKEAPHSCCQKNDHVVVGDDAVAAAPAAPADQDATPAPTDKSTRGMSPIAMVSICMGMLLALVAAFLGKRSSGA